MDAIGAFEGVATVFGSVESDQAPKWISLATKLPVIIPPSLKSLQSPPAAM